MTGDDGVLYLTDAKDVTPAVLEYAESIADAYFPDADKPIDWEDFLDRLADPNGHNDFGLKFDFNEYDNPAVRKIQRHVRHYRRYE